jgi:hypothetical protein
MSCLCGEQNRVLGFLYGIKKSYIVPHCDPILRQHRAPGIPLPWRIRPSVVLLLRGRLCSGAGRRGRLCHGWRQLPAALRAPVPWSSTCPRSTLAWRCWAQRAPSRRASSSRRPPKARLLVVHALDVWLPRAPVRPPCGLAAFGLSACPSVLLPVIGIGWFGRFGVGAEREGPGAGLRWTDRQGGGHASASGQGLRTRGRL